MKIIFHKSLKKIKGWLKTLNFYLQPFLNIISLIVAIIALLISQETLENANTQFEINSKSSDSLFNIQLKNSKDLNDQLVNQIRELQKITNSQLRITDEQLKITVETLKEQVYSGRPKFVIIDESVSDTNMIYDGLYSPKITVVIKNIGKRFANKFMFRQFVVFPDFSSIRYGMNSNDTLIVDSEASIEKFLQPRIPLKYKPDFYFCFEIRYYDDSLKRDFIQSYYRHYYKIRNDYRLNICNNEEEIKLKIIINDFLYSKNEILFDE